MYDFLNLKFNDITVAPHQTDDPLSDLAFMSFLNSLGDSETPTNVAKLGKCGHPKHLEYRREHFLASQTKKVAKTVPRRGRPPKGSNKVVELTVRPLPKRLEAVVGKKNIKVCLTCLKRSDMDKDYVTHSLYVGPQQCQKKKKDGC